MAAFNPVMSMAPPPDLAHRPTMRRKSSAQNLLSSFKNTTAPAQGMPPPSATAMQYPLPTPTVGSVPKDWDIQSLHSDSVASSAGTSIAANGTGPGASVEALRELVRKRIITLTYLRNVHEGRSHWFHTIQISRAELDRAFPNSTMKSRTYRFATLGMALANHFEMKDPHDLFKGWTNVLNEFEQSREDGDKPKKSRLFRTRPQKRPAGAPADYVLTSYQDPTDYMAMPHVPFPLDYHQTLLSLLDVLSELYNKISKILGPSPFPNAGQHMMGPLGMLAPHPGVSYLFAGADAAQAAQDEGSLWGIAHAPGPGTPSVGAMYGGALGSPPPSWNSTMGDTVRNIDSRLKKIIATLLKELDDCARAGIKDELASLDPLLRHVAVPEDVREYDLDA